jgi:hypothetical protein
MHAHTQLYAAVTHSGACSSGAPPTPTSSSRAQSELEQQWRTVYTEWRGGAVSTYTTVCTAAIAIVDGYSHCRKGVQSLS